MFESVGTHEKYSDHGSSNLGMLIHKVSHVVIFRHCYEDLFGNSEVSRPSIDVHRKVSRVLAHASGHA